MRSIAPSRKLFAKISSEWGTRLRAARDAANVDEYPDWPISPSLLFRAVNSAMSGSELDYVCDVGNHQMWAAHGLRLGPRQAVHYSGGMGAMGFALPAALGIALQTGGRALVLTGDGSLQVNIQELDTLKRLGLDIGLVVMNNSSLGMVKNFQDLYFDGRDHSTRQGYSCPDFARVAQAYGIRAARVADARELPQALGTLAAASGPFLLEVDMPYATECRPRLAFGRKLEQQLPEPAGIAQRA
jgi:acetolactate synthase-1/2/3 large subunit